MAPDREIHDGDGHDHDHNHAHDHAGVVGDVMPGYFDIMETAVRELLVEKQLIGASEIRRQIEVLDSRTPALGAKVVARAWVDPSFRARLLADGRAACEELGITFYDDTGLIVLENTDKIHNLIVCTLCSCYPRPVLGLPPDWYKLKPYRRAPSSSRARCWPSLARSFRTTSKFALATRPRRSAIWSCPNGPKGPRASVRSSSSLWSPAMP
jgi:Nitrile hydratase, alpha chain